MGQPTPIPNINIGQVYDQRYADADVHCESLARLAGFFGRNMPAHRHDRFFQLHYVKSGVVRVHLDEQRYEHEAPMFFLTPPTVAHTFVTDAGSEGYVLTVRQQLVWPLLERELGVVHGPRLTPICVALSDLDACYAAEAKRLEGLFDMLHDESNRSRLGRDQALIDLTRLIFISLMRLSSQSLNAQPARREDLAIFQGFNELVEQHYAEHWSLAEYAASLGVSESRLNDVCRRVSDQPSKRLIFERLMQEAKRLLMYSTHSVSSIGYQLGFKDPAYFSRFFLRNAGMTPGEYRREQQPE